jgi:hypothetical protein
MDEFGEKVAMCGEFWEEGRDIFKSNIESGEGLTPW